MGAFCWLILSVASVSVIFVGFTQALFPVPKVISTIETTSTMKRSSFSTFNALEFVQQNTIQNSFDSLMKTFKETIDFHECKFCYKQPPKPANTQKNVILSSLLGKTSIEGRFTFIRSIRSVGSTAPIIIFTNSRFLPVSPIRELFEKCGVQYFNIGKLLAPYNRYPANFHYFLYSAFLSQTSFTNVLIADISKAYAFEDPFNHVNPKVVLFSTSCKDFTHEPIVHRQITDAWFEVQEIDDHTKVDRVYFETGFLRESHFEAEFILSSVEAFQNMVAVIFNNKVFNSFITDVSIGAMANMLYFQGQFAKRGISVEHCPAIMSMTHCMIKFRKNNQTDPFIVRRRTSPVALIRDYGYICEAYNYIFDQCPADPVDLHPYHNDTFTQECE